MADTFTINNIPSPTWNWLHMNDARIEGINGNKSDCKIETEGFNFEERKSFNLSEVRTGMGEEIKKAVEERGSVLAFSAKAGTENKAKLNFEYADSSVNGVEITLEKDAKALVIMNMSGLDCESEATLQTRYHVAEGACLTLVQIERVSKDAKFYNDIGGRVLEDGEFKLIQLILGGHENYYGTFSALEGKRAAFTSDVAYLLAGDEKLDINTVSDHTGKKTFCDINVSGVLRDSAKKVFRGTIDFHRGCAGAKGNEMENVLLMDEGVWNQTIPVILCDEEDVEGNHGASIGNIDEELLFYMKSRGIEEKAVYEMMADALVESVAAKIPDESTREELAR